MRTIKNLNVGDKFRPAVERIVSINGRVMLQSEVYTITKVFAQAPYFSIATNPQRNGVFSLHPDTLVIRPRDAAPSPDDVQSLLSPKAKKQVIGYRLLWDGRSNIRPFVTPQAMAILLIMA